MSPARGVCSMALAGPHRKWRLGGPPLSSCLKQGPASQREAVRGLCTMTPRLLPLLLLLARPPAVQPVPPTCYSRMLTLSREITRDFQSLQATAPAVSPLRPDLHTPGGSRQTQFSNICLWTRGIKKMLFFFLVNINSKGIVFYFHPIKYNQWFMLFFKYKEK